jgi:hypothetical protein
LEGDVIMARMKPKASPMFQEGEDLPLFSLSPVRVKPKPFVEQAVQIERLPGLDQPPDWEEMVTHRGSIIKPRRRSRS